MEFDEYEYLEKAVEETNGSTLEKDAPLNKENDIPPNKEKKLERSDKGHRRRDRREEDDEFGEEEKENRRSSSKKSRSEENGRERQRDRDGDMYRDRERRSRHKSRELDLEKERRSSRDRDRDMDRERRDMDRIRENDRERRDRVREKDVEIERPRRSRSRSRLGAERERDFLRERENGRRHKDKKEVKELEVDPERDQRTVFAYQMPLKADERDVYEFFSQAGKVRDVKLITDRMSRRSKGVGYIEFVDAMSVPMAIALCGHLFLGQPIMVKPSEAEKNLVTSNTSTGGSGVTGPHGATDRKLYVGNLHFNMTEPQLRQIFEAFGPVELVQLPTDEIGQCKGFGFIQFVQVEHAKASLSLNGTLEIAGRTIKVSSVTDHIGAQDSGTKAADFDDDDGGGLALNANSRALLMQKLDRSGISSSMPPAVPAVMGSGFSHQGMIMPINLAATLPVVSMAPEPIGTPSECLLLKNMFDPATEEDPEFDLDIKEDVREECSKYGRVVHIYVDKHNLPAPLMSRHVLIFYMSTTAEL